MPFPTDEHIMQTSRGLVDQLQTLFGKHAGMRPAQAKGILLTGTFAPSSAASALSTAPHFRSSTPLALIIVRFSNWTDIPTIPDTDANPDSRGIAVRFNLELDSKDHRTHTDILAHSMPFFPIRAGGEFLEFLKATEGTQIGEEFEDQTQWNSSRWASGCAGVRPGAEACAVKLRAGGVFRVTAVKLIGPDGKVTYVQYRIVPQDDVDMLSLEEAKAKGDNYLHDELAARLSSSGGGAFSFKLLAQVAEEGDITDDATVHWPEERALVELGVVRVEGLIGEEDRKKEQKYIIFDPIPRVEGIEPSEDPLLEMRAAVYLVSGQQRRAA